MNPKINRKEFLRKSSLVLGLSPFLYRTKLFAGNDKGRKLVSKSLGRTGIKVNAIGIGAARTMEPAIIKAALDNGINFFDTGRRYANGRNEEMLGKVFKGIRDKVVIQSKVKVSGTDNLEEKSKRNRIIEEMSVSVNESLKALQTDYVDVMLLHGVSDKEVIMNEDIMKFMEKIKKEGKARAIGFSTHNNQAELVKVNNEILFYDVIMPAFNHQGAYIHPLSKKHNNWDQEALVHELKIAGKNDIGIAAMKSAAGGPGKDPDTGIESFENALRWVIRQDYISVAAVAMANFEEINENVRAMTF